MLDSLKFVQGAVAKKDFVPALTHFRIKGRQIKGYNGMMGLCSPIDLDLDVTPRAAQFKKAIETCEDTIAIHLTPAGRLAIKSGKFKVFVDCIDEEFPDVNPEGEFITLDGSLLKFLKRLAPFIAEDASRPWARGILFRGHSGYATNNVVLVEHWLGYNFPFELNIPRAAVVELIRIGEEPEQIQYSKNSVTFHFSGNRWLRTQVLETAWPDLSRVLDRPSEQLPVPESLWSSIRSIKPFADDLNRLFVRDGLITTSLDEGLGASVEVPGLIADNCYNFDHFLLLEELATTIDLKEGSPALFFGMEGHVRGAISRMRF